ncbi:MAG: hypothetical protein AAGI28_11520 [Pseudomonadota bacterium]
MYLSHLICILRDGPVWGLAAIGETALPDVPWMRIALVFILCVCFTFAAVGFLRIRYGMPFLPARFVNPIRASAEMFVPEEKRLAIVERLPAGPSSQFLVLSHGKQRYLLHISQQGATVLDRFADELEEPVDL